MPGTHWIHPHFHGAVTLQVAGGASMVFIVKDPPNTLPKSIENAKDIVLVIQQMQLSSMKYVATNSGDMKFSANSDDEIWIVNGK